MKKSYFVTLAIAAGMVTAIGAQKANDPVYKNLKVLPKDISEIQLNKIMDSYNEGLGVTCNYCHVQNKDNKIFDYASDQKNEKEISRKMMIMTMEINERHFPENKNIAAVTCYTCHHGNPMPAVDTADYRAKGNY